MRLRPSVARRIVARLATTAAVLALAATTAPAQVVYSGPLNLAIPNNIDGLFVNVVTGTTWAGPDFPSCPGSGCGYDFNIYGTTTWTLFAPGTAGQPAPVPVLADQRGYVAASTNGPALALGEGMEIGAGSVFNTAGTVTTTNLVGGTNRIFGFRFRNEGPNTVHYGWARVNLMNGRPGTLVDYAFNATAGASIAAGDIGTQVVPEPTTVALLGAGLLAVGGAAARRRRAA